MINTPESPVTVPPILKEELEEELESSFSAAQPTNNKIEMMEHAASFQDNSENQTLEPAGSL